MLRDWRIWTAAGIVLAVAGLTFVLLAPSSHKPPSLPAVASSATPPAWLQAASPATAIAKSAPVRVVIPAIGVNAPVMDVGKNPDGTLATPPLSNGNLAGWYDGSSDPGQSGPAAVIVGHVDNPNPAVFWNLHELVAGEPIEVVLADGQTVTFTVTSPPQQVSKDSFPTQAVYGPTPVPTLRLITCGGAFDGTHYVDNVIVYAQLAASTG